jgi:hypothetical protein
VDNAKYVVIDKRTQFGTIETMFIFPLFVKHKDFCKLNVEEGEIILSAGFVNLPDRHCYGRSTQLNRSANPNTDNFYLKNLFGE